MLQHLLVSRIDKISTIVHHEPNKGNSYPILIEKDVWMRAEDERVKVMDQKQSNTAITSVPSAFFQRFGRY
jgi:hypothetical protein